jgi:serine/threonine protein kinase
VIEKGAELARGNFGVVFKGLYLENECVVKQLIGQDSGDTSGLEKAREELIVEAKVLSTVRPHASIATFFGVCIDSSKPLCLVTELVAGGNLSTVLASNKDDICEADVLSMARDLASGLAHLENSGILHCDIAARNCLVVPLAR